MVISAFPFLNELDLLEYRLRTMSPMVDLFVLLESRVTFSGKPKPLYFEENKHRFAAFRDKIEHLIVAPRPQDYEWRNRWATEDFQRKELYRKVAELNPSVAIFSDTDEIVKPGVVERFLATNNEMMRLDMEMLNFFVDRKDSIKWEHGCIMRWRNGLWPDLRDGNSPLLSDSGWHFQSIGARDQLLEKVESTAHAGEEGAISFRAGLERGELPGLERTSPYPIGMLPLPMQSDISILREKGWLHP